MQCMFYTIQICSFLQCNNTLWYDPSDHWFSLYHSITWAFKFIECNVCPTMNCPFITPPYKQIIFVTFPAFDRRTWCTAPNPKHNFCNLLPTLIKPFSSINGFKHPSLFSNFWPSLALMSLRILHTSLNYIFG